MPLIVVVITETNICTSLISTLSSFTRKEKENSSGIRWTLKPQLTESRKGVIKFYEKREWIIGLDHIA